MRMQLLDFSTTLVIGIILNCMVRLPQHGQTQECGVALQLHHAHPAKRKKKDKEKEKRIN